MIPVNRFNAPYNKECKGKNIFSEHTWYDIYYQIINLVK